MFDDQGRARDADEKPCGPEPPRNFKNRVDEIEEGRAGRLQRLVGNDFRIQQSDREQDQENDAHDCAPRRVVLEKEPRRDQADHEEAEHDDQRIGYQRSGHK
jgi:hypothetical protein